MLTIQPPCQESGNLVRQLGQATSKIELRNVSNRLIQRNTSRREGKINGRIIGLRALPSSVFRVPDDQLRSSQDRALSRHLPALPSHRVLYKLCAFSCCRQVRRHPDAAPAINVVSHSRVKCFSPTTLHVLALLTATSTYLLGGIFLSSNPSDAVMVDCATPSPTPPGSGKRTTSAPSRMLLPLQLPLCPPPPAIMLNGWHWQARFLPLHAFAQLQLALVGQRPLVHSEVFAELRCVRPCSFVALRP